MTEPRDVTRVLDHWFADGPTEAADRVLAEALTQIDHTRQRGPHGVPWRYSEMPTALRLLLVAALMLASAGAALLIAGGGLMPAPEPTPTDEPVTSGPGMVIGTDSPGGWAATRPEIFGNPAGQWDLLVGLRESMLTAKSPEGQDVLLGSMTTNGNRTTLGPTDRYTEPGEYEHHVSEDTMSFTITVLDDTCGDRAALLAGNWTRQHVDAWLQPGDRYRLRGAGLTLDLTVPRSFVNADGQYTDYDGAPGPIGLGYFRTGDWAFAVNIESGPFLPVDRCHPDAGRQRVPGTPDGYLDWNRSSGGLAVGEPARVTVGGYPAVRVDLTGGAGCQPEPASGSVQPNEFMQGMEVREWAIDLGDRMLLALIVDESPMEPLTPEVTDAGEAFVDSIEITLEP